MIFFNSLFLLVQLTSAIAKSMQSQDEQVVTPKNIKRNGQHLQRRQTTPPFILFALPYTTKFVVNLEIGTPLSGSSVQKIPTVIDLGRMNLLVPESCFYGSVSTSSSSSGKKVNTVKFDTTTFRRVQKRASTCPVPTLANGYDYTLSKSATIIPGSFQDSDFIITSTSTNKLQARWPINLQSFPIKKRAIGVPVPPADGVPTAFLGLAPGPFLHNPLPAGVLALAALFNMPNPPQGDVNVNDDYMDEIMDMVIAFGWVEPSWSVAHVNGPPPPGPSGGSCDGASGSGTTQNKRAVTVCSQPSQMMIRGWDVTRFYGNIVWFMVAGVPGYTSLWQLTLQAVQVKYGASSLNKATIAIDAKTKITTPLDTIQFATNSTFILLTPTRVSNIYNSMSNFKPPSITNHFWTYKCSVSPTVSFEFIDLDGNLRILTLNAEDWFHGFSPDVLGWCIGAVQELSAGVTQQSAGLNFFKSFYTVLRYNTNFSAQRIGFAINKRCEDP